MIHRLPILVLLLLLAVARAADDAAGANPAPATSSNSVPVESSFESFRIISDRNIFNQSRSPRSASRETAERRPEPVVHALSLVGTMSYDKGDFAFFDGTNPDFRKPVQPGEKIAGYVVAEISPSSVIITNDTQQFEIKVGQQLRREEDGPWQLSTSTIRLTERAGSAEQTNSTGAEPAASGDGSSEDEALRRLMEKRAKELNE